MTLSIKGLKVTFSLITLSITALCHYPEYHCAECRILFIIMLYVIMLNVIVLNAAAPVERYTVLTIKTVPLQVWVSFILKLFSP